jgi:hypothetical protein
MAAVLPWRGMQVRAHEDSSLSESMVVKRVPNRDDHHDDDQARGRKNLTARVAQVRGGPPEVVEEDSLVQDHVPDCKQHKRQAKAIVRGHPSVATLRHEFHLEEVVGVACEWESKTRNRGRNGNECAQIEGLLYGNSHFTSLILAKLGLQTVPRECCETVRRL